MVDKSRIRIETALPLPRQKESTWTPRMNRESKEVRLVPKSDYCCPRFFIGKFQKTGFDRRGLDWFGIVKQHKRKLSYGLIDLQCVLYLGDEVRVLLRRDEPLGLQVRLEFVFFSVLEMVMLDIESAYPSSTYFPAIILRVHLLKGRSRTLAALMVLAFDGFVETIFLSLFLSSSERRMTWTIFGISKTPCP